MIYLALIATMLNADPVQVPVAGRPPDFSGAVGGPFEVTATAEPLEVRVGQEIRFQIRIAGPGDLSKIRQPDLAGDPEFAKRFAVDNLSAEIGDGFARFQYMLRARNHYVDLIPRVKVVYFNPAIQPSSRGFQTTYTEPFVVGQNPTAKKLPPELREWVLRGETRDEFSQKKSEWWNAFVDAVAQFLPLHTYRSADDQSFLLSEFVWGLPPLLAVCWYMVECRWKLQSPEKNEWLRRLHSSPGLDLPNAVEDLIDAYCKKAAPKQLTSDFIHEKQAILRLCEATKYAPRNSIGYDELLGRVQALFERGDLS